MRFATVATMFVCAFLVCFSASPALAGEAALVNGLDGGYWGLSEKDVAAKAPGEAAEKPAPDSPSRMISWKGEKTSSLMYIDTNADGTVSLSLSYESLALSEKIWGKRK